MVNTNQVNSCTCELVLVDYFTDIPFVARCKCGGYRKIPKEDMPT